MFIQQTSTGTHFALVETATDDWKGQIPTEVVGDVLVSEGPGSINGSAFCYWIGQKDIEAADVLVSIRTHINDHDVVALRYIRALPDDVHPSIRSHFSRILAGVRCDAIPAGSMLAPG